MTYTRILMFFIHAFLSLLSIGVASCQVISHVEENIQHKLGQLKLQNSISVYEVGKKGDKVFANPFLYEGEDILYKNIQEDPTRWRKDHSFWTKRFHSGGVSFRTPKNASLHVTMYHSNEGKTFYEMHLDNWAPKGIKQPINSVRHLFWEVIRNKIFGTSTDQDRIERTLNIADTKSISLQRSQ